VRKIKQGGFFGLEAFFLNIPHLQTISCSAEPAKIQLIPGYFLDVLHTYNSRLVGKFYFYLANELSYIAQATYKLRSTPTTSPMMKNVNVSQSSSGSGEDGDVGSSAPGDSAEKENGNSTTGGGGTLAGSSGGNSAINRLRISKGNALSKKS